MQYAQILSLLKAWESYENEQETVDLEGFARWILRNQSEHREDASLAPRFGGGYAQVSPDIRVNILIHRLQRRWELRTKAIFSASPDISSLSELRILACIAGKAQPKKNEVIGEILLETTTGTMLIQRLAARELLLEIPDLNDRRVVRLQLTEKGQTVLQELGKQISPLMRAFFSPIEEAEKVLLVDLLGRIDGA
jgi:DNA-binding MarR family transcriptional regulator